MKRRVRLDAAFAAPALAHMPPEPKRRLKDALGRLADDPTGRSKGLDVKQLDLSGEQPMLFRLRVGEWRAVYALVGRDVVVLRVFHRRDGYGWLERLDRADVMSEE